MAGNDIFHILSEFFVERHGGVAFFGFAKDFGNRTASPALSPKYRDWPMILLNDDLNALLDLGQHSMKISSHFGFAHVKTLHASIMTEAAAQPLVLSTLTRN
jgi:hypothetical protein